MSTLRRTVFTVLIFANLVSGCLSATEKKSAFPHARVETKKGVPVITVNGQPHGPMIFVQHGNTPPEFMKELYRGGTRLIVLIYSLHDPGFKKLDSKMAALSEQAPGAYIIIRTFSYIEKGWGKEHPGELLDILDDKPPDENHYSFASESWQAVYKKRLAEMVHHVEAASYAGNVIGYIPGEGATDESGHFLWGVDQSPAMLKYFRKWARKRYQNEVEALRRRWKDPRVTFDTLTVPSREEEKIPGMGDFRDPRKSMKHVDYYIAHNEVVCDAIINLARTVKSASRGKSLVGFLFGTLHTTHYLYSGTSLAQKLFEAPEIDFLGTPMPYENRGLGYDTVYRHAIHSMMLHDKLYLSEVDTRTHIMPPDANRYGRPDSLEGSIEFLKRDFGRTLVKQVTGYWFGGHNHFGDEKFLPVFARMQEISQLSLKTDNRYTEGIAVIVDQESLFEATHSPNWQLLNSELLQEFGRFGLPWDTYYLSDLASNKVPDYRLYLFLNTFSVDSRELEIVDKKLKRDGKVLVWLVAPGIINQDAEPPIGAENMSRLTGIKLGIEMHSRKSEMEIQDTQHELTRELPADFKLGAFTRPVLTGFSVHLPELKPQPPPVAINSPVVYVDDPKARVLAQLKEPQKPGFAIKKLKDWTSIYYGSAALPAEMIRRLARYAGLHVFLETDDVFHVNKHFMMIHTDEKAGVREVSLPWKVGKVVELFSEKKIGEDVDSFKVSLKPLSTYLYYWGE